jgi:hypothetical protein
MVRTIGIARPFLLLQPSADRSRLLDADVGAIWGTPDSRTRRLDQAAVDEHDAASSSERQHYEAAFRDTASSVPSKVTARIPRFRGNSLRLRVSHKHKDFAVSYVIFCEKFRVSFRIDPYRGVWVA